MVQKHNNERSQASQIRENAIRETKFIKIEHICGNINPADLFTKEDKDAEHFQRLRDTIVTKPEPPRSNNHDIKDSNNSTTNKT